MKHVVGELIRWITEFSYEDHQYTTYVVYRNGIGDKITLSDRNIFKLKTKEK